MVYDPFAQDVYNLGLIPILMKEKCFDIADYIDINTGYKKKNIDVNLGDRKLNRIVENMITYISQRYEI